MKDKCVDLLIKAHKKLNYIEGFRRIVLVIIGFGVLCALFSYTCTGFIYDTDKFKHSVKVVSNKNKNEMGVYEFARTYILKLDNGYRNDVVCYPYKQECKIDYIQIKNNEKILDYDVQVKMPTRLQYFTWQVLDFLLIFGVALLVWGLYLGIERILVWIISGFKKKD